MCVAFAGVQQLRVNDKYCVEVARLLGVHFSVVKDEASNVSAPSTLVRNSPNQ